MALSVKSWACRFAPQSMVADATSDDGERLPFPEAKAAYMLTKMPLPHGLV